jgi:hypothetical protein
MGKIQKQDIKTVAELTSAGATAADLPNDDQIFVSALNINKTLKDAITEGNIGGGGGELNFLQLSNASWHGESGTTGFATYKDAAQSRPQDGTGGTASVTITTSNTNPLSGNNSLIITKPAGNLQGEGVSVGFAIDRASRARVLKIEFDYLVNSGTFNAGTNTADSDLIVYIYDVDANQLIEPSTFKLYANATNIADRFSGYFQTSASSTNYRLIFHVATTNSSAWSLKVDNVVVAPSKYVCGTPITDWVEYTPQLLGSVTNPTIGPNGYVSGRWRRVGDTVEIQAAAYRGTSGGSAGSGYYYLTMPSGMVGDASKLGTASNVGTGYVFDGGNLIYTGTAYIAGDRTKLGITTDGTNDGIKDTLPSSNWWTSTGNNGFEINATIPIQGWSSSVKMSDGYDGREIAASYGLTALGTLFNNEGTFVDFNNRFYDTTGSVLGSGSGNSLNWQNTWRYIVPASGRYSIKVVLMLGLPGNVFADAFAQITINGQAGIAGSRNAYVTPSDGDARALVVAGDLNLKAGDAISVLVFQSSGANRQLVGFALHNRICIHRISSPQTIAISETVAGYAIKASGQSIPSGTDTVITNWTVLSDTHAIFNPSTGVLTVNRAGFIDLVFSVSFEQNGSGARSCHIFKNNTEFIGLDDRAPFSSWQVSAKAIVSAYPVKAGDTFVFRAWQNSGASLNLNFALNRTYISWRIY